MPAATKHLVIEQGATWQQSFAYKTSAGVAIDLTGYSARLQARPTVSSDVKLIDIATTGPGGITIVGATGTITCTLPASVTAALSFTMAVYDLEIESSTGVVTRLLQGAITLSREVTR